MAISNVVHLFKNATGSNSYPGWVSHSTIETLEWLLDQAKNGDVIGLALVAMRPRRQFTLCASGEARRNPTFTRGMLAALDDELGKIVR